VTLAGAAAGAVADAWGATAEDAVEAVGRVTWLPALVRLAYWSRRSVEPRLEPCTAWVFLTAACCRAGATALATCGRAAASDALTAWTVL
jgi:hypothetical protein